MTDRASVRSAVIATTLSVSLALLLVQCGSQEQRSVDAPSGASRSAPATVSGYGDCSAPGCADVARACDDLIRSGCGSQFAEGRADLVAGTPEFAAAITTCTNVSFIELGESEFETERADSDGNQGPDRLAVKAASAAACTRWARNCQERLNCVRGQFTLPPTPVPVDAGPAPDTTPSEDPEWTKPYRGEGQDPFIAGPPWKSYRPDAGIDLVSGVDSHSCAKCAMLRCPTFAYRCFAADGDPDECPSGDCCHSLRKCVLACGGYGSPPNPSRYYKCLGMCQAARPHAVQQLADLQGCAAVACNGCETLETPMQVLPTGPVTPLVDAGGGG